MGYRFSTFGASSNSNTFGNHILKPGAGEIRKPTWDRTETVVRFLPQFNFAENEWEPYRRSSAPMDFGDWIRRYEAVKGFGESGITLLLYDPDGQPGYDIQSNPCIILYRAINQAIDQRQDKPGWAALTRGAPGRSAALKRHQSLYLARGAIFRIKSKDMATNERSPLGLADRDPAFFMELPKTAGERLISMLEERVENYEGDPNDFENAYKYGDIISLDRGAFVHFFEEGADPLTENQYNPQSQSPRQITVSSGGRGNYGNSSGGGGGTNFKGYDVRIEQTWKGYVANLNTQELVNIIRSKQKPWEECLQFHDHQTQAYLVQDGFPANAILYAWRDHPEWIKDETRSRAVERVSRTVTPMEQPDMPPVNTNTVKSSKPTTVPSRQPVIADGSKVGGWGKNSSANDDPDKPAHVPDKVVPDGLDDTPTPQSNVSEAEARVNQAMSAAKERLANRTSKPVNVL